jgi:hypothetical protein
VAGPAIGLKMYCGLSLSMRLLVSVITACAPAGHCPTTARSRITAQLTTFPVSTPNTFGVE